MPVTSQKRNACVPCTQAKRRCDKKLPACQRCVDKDVLCKYPSTPPYARRSLAVARRVESTDSNGSGTAVATAANYNDTGATTLATYSSWFLDAGSWAIDRALPEKDRGPRIQVTDLKAFPRTIREWLCEWVREGHCPIIHRQLYADVGMPSCLVEAFAALTMWEAKTAQNEDLVMRYIEERSNQLVNTQAIESDAMIGSIAPLQTVEHLARVQALFIYQHIRLFDGDVRQRPLGEACMPLVSEWTSNMWESAGIDAFLQTSMNCGNGLFSQNLSHGLEDPITTRTWRDWLLAESIRRIWLVTRYMHSVYVALRDSQSECPGGIAFTARERLWDAQSAESWTSLVNEKDPLFMMCSRTDHILPLLFAKDVDTFGLSIFAIMGDRQNLRVS